MSSGAESNLTFFVDKNRSEEIIYEVFDLMNDVTAGRSTLEEVIQSILQVGDEKDRNAYIFALGYMIGYNEAVGKVIMCLMGDCHEEGNSGQDGE